MLIVIKASLMLVQKGLGIYYRDGPTLTFLVLVSLSAAIVSISRLYYKDAAI